MLELATRPVEPVEELPVGFGEPRFPALESVPAPAAPDARAVRLRMLAETASPSYVRVFVPKPPVPKHQQLVTAFDTTFWATMAICAGVWAVMLACIGFMGFAFASGLLR